MTPRAALGLAFALAAVSAPLAAGEPVAVAVPSGQSVALSEVLSDENPGALWLRFRFVAPGIARDGGGVSADTAAADMDWICLNLALPYIEKHGLDPARIVISLSDRAVPFGTSDQQATQYFETYKPENGTCIWEAF